jgi:hypothetical protein
LERTYQFVQTCKLDLLGVSYTEAKEATTCAERTQAAAEAMNPKDIPTKQGERSDLGNLPKYQASRADSNGISERQQRKLDALARKAPEAFDRVKAGELSVHRACVEAGITKELTALEKAQAAARGLSSEDWEALVCWHEACRKSPGVDSEQTVGKKKRCVPGEPKSTI